MAEVATKIMQKPQESCRGCHTGDTKTTEDKTATEAATQVMLKPWGTATDAATQVMLKPQWVAIQTITSVKQKSHRAAREAATIHR